MNQASVRPDPPLPLPAAQKNAARRGVLIIKISLAKMFRFCNKFEFFWDSLGTPAVAEGIGTVIWAGR